MGYVYYIKCDTNDKIYIGSTTRSSTVRRNEHYYLLRKGIHTNKHLQNAWNKYGENSFTYGVLDKTSKNVMLLEWHYVNITKCYLKEVGFNKSKIVSAPNRGKVMSDAQKKKISESLKGRPSPMKGRKSEAAKRNIKIANKAQWRSVTCLNDNCTFETVKSFCNNYKINTTSFHRYVGTGKPFKGLVFDYTKGSN